MAQIGYINTADHRTTHRYVGDCAHLDEWDEHPWKWRVLSEKRTDEWGYDGGVVYTLRIKVYGDHTEEQLREVLSDNFVRGCACMHDCCGHLHGGLSKIFTPANRRKNEYIARVVYYPNY